MAATGTLSSGYSIGGGNEDHTLRGARRWRSQGWTSRWQFSFCSPLSSFCWAVLVFVAAHSRGFSSCSVRATLFAACRLRCPMACGILVPQSEVKSASPALEDGLSIPGPPGRFLLFNLETSRCPLNTYCLIEQTAPNILVPEKQTIFLGGFHNMTPTE